MSTLNLVELSRPLARKWVLVSLCTLFLVLGYVKIDWTWYDWFTTSILSLTVVLWLLRGILSLVTREWYLGGVFVQEKWRKPLNQVTQVVLGLNLVALPISCTLVLSSPRGVWMDVNRHVTTLTAPALLIIPLKSRLEYIPSDLPGAIIGTIPGTTEAGHDVECLIQVGPFIFEQGAPRELESLLLKLRAEWGSAKKGIEESLAPSIAESAQDIASQYNLGELPPSDLAYQVVSFGPLNNTLRELHMRWGRGEKEIVLSCEKPA